MSLRRASESDLTYRLKWAAWEWLYTTVGCRVIGFEVSFEGPGGRIADVAGLGPDRSLYLVEVKISRGDLHRDDHDAADKARLAKQERALRRMSDLAGEIAETAPADVQASLDAALLERRLALHPKRVAALSTKFHDPRYLRIADYNYIMAPEKLVRRSEVPPFWGLLDPTPRVVAEATRVAGNRPLGVIANVIRSVARANTRDLMRAYGVRWREEGAVFPQEGHTEEDAAPAAKARLKA